MEPRYRSVDDFPGWAVARERLLADIARLSPRSILEVGSGANPTLTAEDIDSLGVEYTTNDIDERELDKAPSGFRRLAADLCAPDPTNGQRFDLIFSRMVNEHVPDGRAYYSNIAGALTDGGTTIHHFSTLYALPFLVNRLVPAAISDMLLQTFNPRDEEMHGKFPARYSWSRGPTRRQIQLFEGIGFEVVEYTGYFGHAYYRRRLPLLDRLERAKSSYLVSHPLPRLCSYASVELRKVASSLRRD